MSYVYLCAYQHLTPLELVKAARRVSGDSTDVGTADNLWGEGSSATEKPKMVSGWFITLQYSTLRLIYIHSPR